MSKLKIMDTCTTMQPVLFRKMIIKVDCESSLLMFPVRQRPLVAVEVVLTV